MAKIAIVGVGAIGAVVAAILQSSGRHEILLCTRRSLAELVVETPEGQVRVDATVVTSPTEASAVDWVLVATKAYDVAGASAWLPQLRASGAPVAVLQNGVEHKERFAPWLPPDAILPVIVDCPAERKSPERVVQRGGMTLKVPSGSPGDAFVKLFAGTSADAAAVPDFLTAAWRKLCLNAAGILPALLLQPAGVMRDDAIGEVAIQLVSECVEVGRAEGAQLDDTIPEAVLNAYRAQPPDSLNSLHADRLAGRPMEIEARNGVIVRLGKKHGIPTPTNSMAVALLKEIVRNTQ
jgi:2-dehydropantoate 2-reductase